MYLHDIDITDGIYATSTRKYTTYYHIIVTIIIVERATRTATVYIATSNDIARILLNIISIYPIEDWFRYALVGWTVWTNKAWFPALSIINAFNIFQRIL